MTSLIALERNIPKGALRGCGAQKTPLYSALASARFANFGGQSVPFVMAD